MPSLPNPLNPFSYLDPSAWVRLPLSGAVARLAYASRAIAPASDIERLLYPNSFDISTPAKFILHRAASIFRLLRRYWKT